MAASRNCPSCAAQNPERARFCMSCGDRAGSPLPQLRQRESRRRAVLHGVRRRARRGGRQRPDGRPRIGGARPRPERPTARGAPPGHGPVRRPLRLHRRRGAHGPRGGQGAGRPDPAPPGRGDRALRRQHRQVHRRQRDGRLRGAGRPRGRPRARGARGARDAGRDGGGQPRDRRAPRRQLLAARRPQLRAR